MGAGTGAAPSDGASAGKRWRDSATRLSLPVLTTVVSAVLVATFVTSRQDARSQRRARDLQTKALIANDMSESAVRLIFAAETRTKALVLGNKKPASAAKTSRSLADFQATSIFIRAKLEAYYDDQTVAAEWKRYTNAVGAFLDIGAVQAALGSRSGKQLESRDHLVKEIRRGLRPTRRADDVLAAISVGTFDSREDRLVYMGDYDRLENLLIERGAELTRRALK